MNITITPFDPKDVTAVAAVWNRVVTDGVAFPQKNRLTDAEAVAFFTEQDYTGVAKDCDTGEVVGMYILHPNNIGRCGHICNASYAVKYDRRGMGIGRALVTHCMQTGKRLGYRILQFNAVVATNTSALTLYKSLGFVQLGTIPGGFLMDNGHFEDIVPHYIEL